VKEENIVKSTHPGKLQIGNIELECHVLEDGRRIFSAYDFLQAFGINPEPKEKKQTKKIFLERVKFISVLGDKALYKALNTPIKFKKTGKGGNFLSNGYQSDLLPEVCNAILTLAENKMLPVDFEIKNAAKQSRKILKAFANVGVTALIDEATGYQEYRDKYALRDILDKYLEKEYSAWAKRFPDDFYKEMFRLKKWEWRGMNINRPGVVGTYTKNIVYSRLAPGLLKELENRNPPEERKRVRHHQWLTIDVGHPALDRHLAGVLAVMKISHNWKEFERQLTKVYPVLGEQLYLDLDEDAE
jgi:hypothetical protein